MLGMVWMVLENVATAQVTFMSYRGVQIPGTMFHGQLKFLWWCLVFVGSQCGTCFMSVMVPRILRCLLGFLKICVPLKWWIICWSSRKLCFLLPFSKPSSQPNYSKYYLVMAGFIFRSICKLQKVPVGFVMSAPPAWDILTLAGEIFMIYALFALLL
jgi:hypothetical protein